jgi:hypothetical protein
MLAVPVLSGFISDSLDRGISMMLPGYDNWKTTDPNLEAPLCPVCDSVLEGDKWEGECSDEDCDHTYTTDYEAFLEVRYY